MSAFNLEAVYDAEIRPLVAQLIDVAQRHDMPVFFSANYAEEPTGERQFCTTCIPGTHGCKELESCAAIVWDAQGENGTLTLEKEQK